MCVWLLFAFGLRVFVCMFVFDAMCLFVCFVCVLLVCVFLVCVCCLFVC